MSATTRRQKGDVYRTAAPSLVGAEWTAGDLTIRILTFDVDEHHRLIVTCEAAKNGQPLALDLPFVYVNPPLLVPTGREHRRDPAAAIRIMVAETAALFA